MKKTWLDGKTFIISGASSGIGKGIAEKLIIKHGCKVIGIGRNENKFIDFSAKLGENAKLLTYRTFDVTDENEWKNLAKDLEKDGIRPDGIINCAGILPRFKKALDTETEDVIKVTETNFFSCVYSINATYPLISRSDTPAIVNVSSAAALATIVGTSAYSAAKSALKSYTEALIYELKGKAYVSLVMPGFARTDIFRSQNTSIDENKLIKNLSMPAYKTVNAIHRGIKRKKTRIIIGKDAHAMNFFYRLFPKFTMGAIKKVLKGSKLKLFEDVFCDD
ncbi:MAG: SDR family NAD(P)-dependent oxidoreductase [Clostridia bacterium]|nr:SDR family NAD(P)-dependent oxidoreductase [Clostridia bacterium]